MMKAGGEDGWEPFAGGRSIGGSGSDEGTITRDEAHPLGARITLEREPALVPFAVTCAVYGWMAHTRYFRTEGEAQAAFEEMKPELAGIVELIARGDDSESGVEFEEVRRAVEEFVERFPMVERGGG